MKLPNETQIDILAGIPYVIRRYIVLPSWSKFRVYDVWQPNTNPYDIEKINSPSLSRCSTFTSFPLALFNCLDPFPDFLARTYDGHVWFGQVGTECLPDEINKIPPGDTRTKAVRKFFTKRENFAYQLILKHFPEAENGERSAGEIRLYF